MAKKRRTRRRKPSRLRPPNSQTSTMSSEDSYALNSGRQSSDGTVSERTTSDSTRTAMTSIMDTDEEAMPDDEIEVDDEDDMISIYPVSHYPGTTTSSHPTEMPYSPDGYRGANSDIAASTRSLWAQDLDYREIHGRRYCREYYMPNDEIEQVRLALQHQVFIHVLEGELTRTPIKEPTHILDVGTGTGEWAIRMAELYPRCDVVGTDIAAIAETQSVPMNVFFEIEDAEDWDRQPEMYDLIHFRCMEGAFQNWRFIYDNAFYSLKPNGWIEVQDFDSAEGLNKFLSMFPEDSPIHDLYKDLEIAAQLSKRPRGPKHLDPRTLMEAGFVDVKSNEYTIPITIAEKSAGKIWLISCLDSLEANCLRLLTTYMGWDPERCKEACETAARHLANLAKDPEASKGLQIKMRVVIGRKPMISASAANLQPPDRPISPNTQLLADDESADPTIHGVEEGELELETEAMDTDQQPAKASASSETRVGAAAEDAAAAAAAAVAPQGSA